MKRRIRVLIAVVTVLSVLLFCSAALAGGETVRVAWYALDGLQELNGGAASGYNYEYLQAVAQYTGWKYEFVPGTLSECFARIEKGEADIMGGLAYKPERARFMDYTDTPSGYGGDRLTARLDDQRFSYGDYQAVAGKNVGVLKSSAVIQKFGELCTRHKIAARLTEFNDTDAMLAALKSCKIDLACVSMSTRLSGCKEVLNFGAQPFYFAVSKKSGKIYEQLNYAVGQIEYLGHGFSAEMQARYFNAPGSLCNISFTAAEKRYLAVSREITVAYDPAWNPIEYRDERSGTIAGMTKDIYAQISAATGLKFRFVTADSFAETVSKYTNKAQMFSLLTFNYDWADRLGCRLTQPMMDIQIVRVYTKSPGKIVAMPNGYYLTSFIKKKFSGAGYQYVLYPTIRECVEAVYKGKADSTFLNSFEFSYYSNIPRYAMLKYQESYGMSQQMAVAVSSSQPDELYSIMNKTVSCLLGEKLDRIIADGTRPGESSSLLSLVYTDPLEVMAIGAVFLLLLAGIVFALVGARSARRRSSELSELNARLVKASAAKSEFLSRISHDIRTPMNGIIGMTYIAKSSNDPAKTAACLDKIDMSSKFLLGLINDVLDMSKAESGKIELHAKPYPAEELRKYIEAIVTPLCREKKQQLSVDVSLPEGCVPVLDKLRVNQIVFNLLSNAVKFSPPGGSIKFRASGQPRADGQLAMRLEVEDNGAGMSEEFQKILFEPFSQEGRDENSEHRGSGLGLAISKRLAELMGGSIAVKSKLGEGSLFTVELVCGCTDSQQLESCAEPPREDALDAERFAGRRVLLCEDHPVNQEIARALLEQKKIIVETAGDGLQGVEKFRLSPSGYYDLILMDIRMPKLDGYEAARQIRALARPDANSVPIVAMTADAFAEDVQKCLEAGMNGHLAKPIDVEKLYEKLAKMLP